MHSLLVQFRDRAGQRRVAFTSELGIAEVLLEPTTTYELALRAVEQNVTLANLVKARASERVSHGELAQLGELLPPFDHPDPAHLLVSGTGLTHSGSATLRSQLHGGNETDTIKLFRMGLAGGKPEPEQVGVAPEWFYKGDGSCIAPPEADLVAPAFGDDASEEPEIASAYLIDAHGVPRRLGFVLGNELSDHVLERQNYLYLAHSKLRPCSIGPGLLLGELPGSIEGRSRILRDGKAIWDAPFVTGEEHMCHSIANIEHHLFKYPQFRRPGDLHCHFFGTATLSFGELRTEPGDLFEISAPCFLYPLRNRLRLATPEAVSVRPL